MIGKDSIFKRQVERGKNSSLGLLHCFQAVILVLVGKKISNQSHVLMTKSGFDLCISYSIWKFNHMTYMAWVQK